jgi:hypothetical protein
MKMKYKTTHFDNCSAPICNCTHDEEAIWLAGEEVCSRQPLEKFQRVQNNINKLVLRGKVKKDRPYKLADLKRVRLSKN